MMGGQQLDIGDNFEIRIKQVNKVCRHRLREYHWEVFRYNRTVKTIVYDRRERMAYGVEGGATTAFQAACRWCIGFQRAEIAVKAAVAESVAESGK